VAIPKKGSRKIVVDNVEYRWYIRRNTKAEDTLVVAVQRFTELPTSILLVKSQMHRPDSNYFWFRYEPKPSLTPNHVATHIRAALAAGWNPLQSGAPFIYRPKVV
jgi:hypothetical protein